MISLLLVTLPSALAHSWVERLMRVELNGTMIGNPGYIRGTVPRSSTSFLDHMMQHLLSDSLGPICKATQRTQNYTVDLLSLKTHARDLIALQYQENGHVTLPENTPHKADSGIVYVYGTSHPSEEDILASIHEVWNKDGTGGDQRGRLLASWSFDDGCCYQINGGQLSRTRQQDFFKTTLGPMGADSWCQIDFQLPIDIQGLYTLYWVWDWPSNNPGYQAEYYTSCMDQIHLPSAVLI